MRRTGFIETTTIAAFECDHQSRIVACNAAAERLLRCRTPEVLGSRCFEVVGGRDPYGNLFCGPECAVRRTASRGEPIHPYEIVLQRPPDESLRVRCSIIVSRGPRSRRCRFTHLLEPVDARPEGIDQDPPDPARDGPASSPGAGMDPSSTLRLRRGALTARERAILALLAAGSDTTQTACNMGISAHTVRNHVQHILYKLEAHSRLQAILRARRARLI